MSLLSVSSSQKYIATLLLQINYSPSFKAHLKRFFNLLYSASSWCSHSYFRTYRVPVTLKYLSFLLGNSVLMYFCISRALDNSWNRKKKKERNKHCSLNLRDKAQCLEMIRLKHFFKSQAIASFSRECFPKTLYVPHPMGFSLCL